MRLPEYYGVYWQEGGIDFDMWCGHKHATLVEAANCIKIELIETPDAWVSVMAHAPGNRRELTTDEKTALNKFFTLTRH